MLILNILFLFIIIALGKPIADSKNLDLRIIGGRETNITEVPWQLAHLVYGVQECGGIIIGPREVLSAGHCYTPFKKGFEPSANQYRAGSNDKNEGGTIHDIDYYVIHPEYNETTDFIYHDITFVRVKQPFNFSEFVQPIKLADKEPEDGAEALISGWGIYELDNGQWGFPTILQSERLPVVDRKKCQEWYTGFEWKVMDDQVCVGTYEGGLGGCSGDSGGPMVVNDELVGIASWTDLCAMPHHPTVYTSVPYYKDWIQQQMKSNKKK